MNDINQGLTIEQQLNLRLFAEDLKKLTEQELKVLLVEMFKESMIQHVRHADQLAKHWGIK
jgi:hypothetical protein